MSFKPKRRSSVAKVIFINGPYAGKSVSLLPGKTITIGRDRAVELPLEDETLSRRHCSIEVQDNKYFITDHNSINGTFVNGTRLSGKSELLAFDRIFFGSTEMEFREEGDG